MVCQSSATDRSYRISPSAVALTLNRPTPTREIPITCLQPHDSPVQYGCSVFIVYKVDVSCNAESCSDREQSNDAMQKVWCEFDTHSKASRTNPVHFVLHCARHTPLPLLKHQRASWRGSIVSWFERCLISSSGSGSLDNPALKILALQLGWHARPQPYSLVCTPQVSNRAATFSSPEVIATTSLVTRPQAPSGRRSILRFLLRLVHVEQ